MASFLNILSAAAVKKICLDLLKQSSVTELDNDDTNSCDVRGKRAGPNESLVIKLILEHVN